ncbi:MbtH family protein [Rhodanobacter sp. DHG33]|uniref:MbtH family protein n=1 Tax=Rhodanobacter sp. DHG33 TaxID=2775921 RepID=UPI00177BEAAA|nr:MbtH family protein [Rhodanobacter sp. DHG33]MBD8897914.1 MbtH family protein [Rhodanobacter sp. DHG33]
MVQSIEEVQSQFLALVNGEGQYSLWPSFAEVPAGWKIRNGPDSRKACLEYIEREWIDIRPLSVVKALECHEAVC